MALKKCVGCLGKTWASTISCHLLHQAFTLTRRWRDSFVETRRASHFRRTYPSAQRREAQIGRTQFLTYYGRGCIGFRQLHLWNRMDWHPHRHYSQVNRFSTALDSRSASWRPWQSWPTHWSARRQPSPIGMQSWRHSATHRQMEDAGKQKISSWFHYSITNLICGILHSTYGGGKKIVFSSLCELRIALLSQLKEVKCHVFILIPQMHFHSVLKSPKMSHFNFWLWLFRHFLSYLN